MKVTVTFGATAVVVPCKGEWTVRELVDQANQRYRKILEQNGEDFLVRTHRMEYCDGGILDLDDLLTDLVEDRDKLVAVFEAQELQRGATVSPAGSGGGSTGHSSPSPYSDPDPYERQPPYFQPPRGGEIEVNAYTLKANTPLLVRSSSDSALAPPLEIVTPPPDDLNARPAETDASHALTNRREPKDRLRLDIPTTAKMSRVTLSPLTETVELSGEQGPLGIHVVPYCSSLSGRTLGLHIKGIEANSRSKREGIFQEDECIVQINGTELMDKTFAQSQEVFRQAMCSPLVRLEILPLDNKQRYEKRLIGQLFTDGHDSIPKAKSPLMIHQKMDAKPEGKPEQINPKLEPRHPDLHVLRSKNPDLPASLTPLGEHQTGHVPEEMPLTVSPAPVVRDRDGASPTAVGGSESPLPRGKSPTGLPNLANLTNQKGGRKLKIDLKKGTEGLGFTVVTRDSTVHGPGPILIKNILPRGAAIKDGRLQPGDRILEVNGVDMTDRTQEELVAMLRSTKQGDCVSVVVVRQEDLFLPRELKGEEASPLVLEDGREQLMFEVPLNDTGSAGLGISLKGNKSREKGEDLGIFIKSIIHGGAAYKDGRLRVNDQLIAVNGEALLGRSNHVAMETLRHSMSLEGNARGTIQLVLLRPAPSSGSAHNTNAQVRYQRDNDHRGSLLRRRASDPRGLRYRHRYMQGSAQSYTLSDTRRYTMQGNLRSQTLGNIHEHTQGAAHSEVHSSTHRYSEGLVQVYTQENTHSYTDDTMQKHTLGNVPHSHTTGDVKSNAHKFRSLDDNVDRYARECTRRHTPDTIHRPIRSHTPDNVHSHTNRSTHSQTHDNTRSHTRSHSPDNIHISNTHAYAESIRALTGAMYGDLHRHAKTHHLDINRNAHGSNYTHNQDLNQHHHHRLSGL